jgi:hypothetical protein
MLLSSQLEISAFPERIDECSGGNGALSFRHFGLTMKINGIHNEFNLVSIHDLAFTHISREWIVSSLGIILRLRVVEESLPHSFGSSNRHFTVFHIYAHQRQFKHVTTQIRCAHANQAVTFVAQGKLVLAFVSELEGLAVFCTFNFDDAVSKHSIVGTT